MSEKQSGSSKGIHLIEWITNEPIDVDAYEEINKDRLPATNSSNDEKTQIPPKSACTKHPKEINRICKLFGLNPKLPLLELKKEFRKKFTSSDLNLNIIDSSEAKNCTSIHISQMPEWFKFFHVKALIQLKSDFDTHSKSFYIDMFKDDQNKHTGECLIRFMENKECLQVYKDLQGIYLYDILLPVKLDLDHKIATERESLCPKFEEQLRKYNETREKFKQQIQQELMEKEKANIDTNNIVIKKEIQEETINNITIENVESFIKQEPENTTTDNPEINETAQLNNPITNINPLIKEELEENIISDNNNEINQATTNFLEDVDIKTDVVEYPMDFEDNEIYTNIQQEINQATTNFWEDVAFKTDVVGCSMDFTDNESGTNIQQESLERNTWEVIQEPVNNASNHPSNQGSTEIVEEDESLHSSGAPKDEYYYYYNKCRIVHIKNITKNAAKESTFIIQDLLYNKTGTEIKFNFKKITVDEKTVDLLLKFRSQEDAVRACKILNGVVIQGSKIKAVMGLGYDWDQRVTLEKLDSYESRMQMIKHWEREKGHTPKRVHNSSAHQTPEKPGDSFAPAAAVDYRVGYLPAEEMCSDTFGLSREFMNQMKLTLPFTRRIIVSHSNTARVALSFCLSIRGSRWTEVTNRRVTFAFIGNLHPEVNEVKLREVFSLAGDVKKLELNTDSNNDTQARIEYDHPLEAVQAMSMFHKHLLYNKEMKISMDRSKSPRLLPVGLSTIGKGLGFDGEPLRAVRIEAEKRKINEIFCELGKMEKYGRSIVKKGISQNSTAFNYEYKKKYLSNMMKAKIQKKGAAGYQQTQDYLASHGIAPTEMNCQNLHNIMADLQKTTSNNPTAVPNTQNTSMNIVSTSLNIQNRNLAPNVAPIGNLGPKPRDPLDEAINRVMQFMTPNTLPNLQPIAHGFQNPGLSGNIGATIPSSLPQNPLMPPNLQATPVAQGFQNPGLSGNIGATIPAPLQQNPLMPPNLQATPVAQGFQNPGLSGNIGATIPAPLQQNPLMPPNLQATPVAQGFQNPGLSGNIGATITSSLPQNPLMPPNLQATPVAQGFQNPGLSGNIGATITSSLQQNPLMPPNLQATPVAQGFQNPGLSGNIGATITSSLPQNPLMPPNLQATPVAQGFQNPGLSGNIGATITSSLPQNPLMPPNLQATPVAQGFQNPGLSGNIGATIPAPLQQNPLMPPNLQTTPVVQGLQNPGLLGHIGPTIPAPLQNPLIGLRLENAKKIVDPKQSKSNETDSRLRKDKEERRNKRSRSRDSRDGADSRRSRDRDTRRRREDRDRSRSRENRRSRSRERVGKYSRYGRESEERDYRRPRDSIERDSRGSEERIQSKKSEMLVFSNLPASVTNDSLLRKMRELGEVAVCEMTVPGRAFLRFVKPDHADLCIRMFHRSKVDGQIIDVQFL